MHSRVSIDEASDQELVELVRAGDADAYATLWRRHSGPAYGVARTFGALDADDLVSEAFAKVLGAIRSGGGPARAFRPYITMTVRNIGRSLYVREAMLVDADFEWRGGTVADAEQVAVVDFERCAALRAFDSLPVRWQEVLWYSEVDGMKVGTIGTYLGIPANAVSALLLRAKRALRDAWVAAHLAEARTPQCAATIRDLGAYTRRRLSLRAGAAVARHLRSREQCRAAHSEATHASSLILSLLPIVAGVAGAVGYAAHAATAPALPQALAAILARPDAVADAVTATTLVAPVPIAAVVASASPVAVGAAVGIGSPVAISAASTAVLSVMTAVIIAAGSASSPVEALPVVPPRAVASTSPPGASEPPVVDPTLLAPVPAADVPSATSPAPGPAPAASVTSDVPSMTTPAATSVPAGAPTATLSSTVKPFADMTRLPIAEQPPTPGVIEYVSYTADTADTADTVPGEELMVADFIDTTEQGTATVTLFASVPPHEDQSPSPSPVETEHAAPVHADPEQTDEPVAEVGGSEEQHPVG